MCKIDEFRLLPCVCRMCKFHQNLILFNLDSVFIILCRIFQCSCVALGELNPSFLYSQILFMLISSGTYWSHFISPFDFVPVSICRSLPPVFASICDCLILYVCLRCIASMCSPEMLCLIYVWEPHFVAVYCTTPWVFCFWWLSIPLSSFFYFLIYLTSLLTLSIVCFLDSIYLVSF
jgi:hypothetical protein